MSGVWLCGVSAALGRLCPIAELRDEGESQQTVELPAEKGVETFSRFEGSPLDIVARHVVETLRGADVAPGDVDGVLIVTESFSECIARPVARGETPLWAARGSLFDLLAELGVRRAPIFCSTFGGSSNFLQARSGRPARRPTLSSSRRQMPAGRRAGRSTSSGTTSTPTRTGPMADGRPSTSATAAASTSTTPPFMAPG